MGPYERLLWSNSAIAVGSADIPPHAEDFETAGEIGDWPAIAFSRTAVGIAHANRRPIVSDGTVAVLHNPHYPFRRFRVGARGDVCDWVSIDAELLLGLNSRLGRDPRRPFLTSTVPLDRRAAALVRLIVRHLRDWTPPDALWVEETLMEVLSGLGPDGSAPRRPRASERHDRLVHRVRELLSSRSEHPWSVTSIAKVLETSAFHACRVFRSRTGYTLHGYLTEQRLRRGLIRLERGAGSARPGRTPGLREPQPFHGAFPTRVRRHAVRVPPARDAGRGAGAGRAADARAGNREVTVRTRDGGPSVTLRTSRAVRLWSREVARRATRGASARRDTHTCLLALLLNSLGRGKSSHHGQNDPEPSVPAQHPVVGRGGVLEREGLDRGRTPACAANRRHSCESRDVPEGQPEIERRPRISGAPAPSTAGPERRRR